MKKNNWIIYPLVAIVVVACCLMLNNKKTQAINWSYSFFSGAANLDWSFQWKISATEYSSLSTLPESEYRNHRYQRSDSTVLNRYNNFGYVIVAFLARNVFTTAGDITAVVYLQVILHILSVFLLLPLLKTPVQKFFFVGLYAINPLVLFFVTFPFYYYCTVIPSVVFCYFYLSKRSVGYWIFPVTLLLYLSYLIRPTTVFIILAVYLFFFFQSFRYQKLYSVAGILFFSILVLLFNGKPKEIGVKSESPLWHTAYIGFGAYPNRQNVKMTDAYLYEKYQHETGNHISTNPVQGTFQDSRQSDQYFDYAKQQYFTLLKSEIFGFIRNGALNTVQAFGPGYFIDNKWLSGISVLVGIFVICLIGYAKRYWLGICIIAYAAGYTVFYPPIPAYNFGAYLPVFLVLTFFCSAMWEKGRRLIAFRIKGQAAQ